MTTRERRRDDDRLRQAPGADGGGPDGPGLDAARSAGQEFLRAGQDAIQRALSGDSLSFLRATRQSGGQ